MTLAPAGVRYDNLSIGPPRHGGPGVIITRMLGNDPNVFDTRKQWRLQKSTSIHFLTWYRDQFVEQPPLAPQEIPIPTATSPPMMRIAHPALAPFDMGVAG